MTVLNSILVIYPLPYIVRGQKLFVIVHRHVNKLKLLDSMLVIVVNAFHKIGTSERQSNQLTISCNIHGQNIVVLSVSIS